MEESEFCKDIKCHLLHENKRQDDYKTMLKKVANS